MDNLITFTLLGTWTVCIAVTTLITQFVKKFIKLDPQIISCTISVILLQLANGFTNGWTIEGILISLINGVLVGLSCNGVFDAIDRGFKN